MTPEDISFHPLTPNRWPDFEHLFGDRGAVGGCWCMWWRLKGSEFEAQAGEANQRAMKAIVESGEVPGILAYQMELPVGWCSVAPRERFGRLNRSPILKPVDEKPVWSVACFFIHRAHRGQGLSAALLGAANEYVNEQGGRIVEGYPIAPRTGGELPNSSFFTGHLTTFQAAGFVEVARRSETRPIMRCDLTQVFAHRDRGRT
jgi:GNAT superfamily N-acetyltransferase